MDTALIDQHPGAIVQPHGRRLMVDDGAEIRGRQAVQSQRHRQLGIVAGSIDGITDEQELIAAVFDQPEP